MKNILPLINTKNLIKSEPSESLPISIIAENRASLMIPTRPIEFIHQYPSIFREFFPADTRFQPHIKLGEAFFKRAKLKMAMGRHGKVELAIGDLDRVVEFSPENARAFCLLGECYKAKKMEAEARKPYEDALRNELELALAREALDRLVSSS